MPRLSREERRKQYLDAAVELLIDDSHHSANESGLALAHVKLDDVAARAGVSKGALYHIWPSQEAYWAELLDVMLTSTTSIGPQMIEWISEVVAPGYDGPVPTFKDFSHNAFVSRSTNPALFIRASLHAYRTGSNVEESLAEESVELGDRFGDSAATVFGHAKRRLGPAISPEAFISTLEGLMAGLALMRHYNSSALADIQLPDGASTDWYCLANEAAAYYYSVPTVKHPPVVPFGHLLDVPLDKRTLQQFDEYHKAIKKQAARPFGDHDRAASYLQIGLDLVREISPQSAASRGIDAFANIRIADVAKYVGVSKGSLYHLWPDQESFRLEVLSHLLESWSQLSAQMLGEVVQAFRTQDLTPDEFLQAVCDTAFDALKTDDRFFARFSFALYLGNPEISKMFRDGNLEINALFGQLLDEHLAAKGLRIRPGLPEDILITYAEAAVHGLCFIYRFNPEPIDGHRTSPKEKHLDPRPPSRLAEIMAALVEHLTQPI